MGVHAAGSASPDIRSLWVAYVLSTHQAELPVVLLDPLASRIVPIRVDLTSGLQKDSDYAMKLAVVMFHRLADDVVAAALASGITQLVVLDAGLSTLCHRRPYPGVRLFEVDLGETQRWKRQSLALAGVGVQPSLTYVEIGPDHNLDRVDFRSGGYDFDAPTMAIWLDASVFLPEDAFTQTLDWLAQHSNRLEVVISYLQPLDTASARTRELFRPVLDAMARANRPLVSFFEPAYVRDALCKRGFDTVDNICWSDLLARYRPADDIPDPLGGYVVHAVRRPADQ